MKVTLLYGNGREVETEISNFRDEIFVPEPGEPTSVPAWRTVPWRLDSLLYEPLESSARMRRFVRSNTPGLFVEMP